MSQGVACGGCFPPDTHGAVGTTEFLEVTNRHYDVYRKSDHALLQSVTLNSKMGEPGGGLFDPRALYDNYWNRFITVATRKASSTSDAADYLRLSVSPGGNAVAGTFNYRVNFSGGIFAPLGTWIDYPMIGYDQNAILITGNVYREFTTSPPCNPGTSCSVYQGTFAISLPKSDFYNGRQTASVPIFSGLPFRIAPPIVEGRGQRASTMFAAVDDANNQIRLFRMLESSSPPDTTLVNTFNTPVNAFVAPPLADQPGAADLDPVSVSFQNNVHQVGTSLWAIHTTGGLSGSWDIPRYYQINWTSGGVVRQGAVTTSGSTDDWNASIAVSGNGNEVFVTFSSTSPTINPQMRVAGCQVSAGDCDANLGPGTLIATSPSALVQTDSLGRNRWGDYSAVTLDPVASGTCAAERRAWAVNEKGLNSSTWGSHIAGFGFC